MGLLGEIYSFGNRTRNKLRGLLDDPKGYLQQTADQTANTLRDMTGANETAQQFALRDKINAGDKNALEQYRNLEKTIQNKLFDVALNFNPAAVGMFIGKGAKTWDAAAAAEAEKRLSAGDDARKVWSELGVFRGPDGHLRQEIDDSKISVFAPIKKEDFGRDLVRDAKLGSSLDHDALYDAYHIEALPTEVRISADAKSNYQPPKYGEKIDASGWNEENLKSNLIHEIQHAIQQREKFAPGGTPLSSERNNLDRFAAYWRNAGEAEARATQARMNMDMAQRRATFPLDSYDVPVNQLIIRGGLLK